MLIHRVVLSAVYRRDVYGFFLEPVETSIITDYLSVIKTPMDLGSIRNKVEQRVYDSLEAFEVSFSLFSISPIHLQLESIQTMS